MTQKNKKPIPQHAYSFSASGLLAVAAGLNYLFDGDTALTAISSLAAVGLIAHGMYDLHRERRLHKLISPLMKLFNSAPHQDMEPAQFNAAQPYFMRG